MVTLNSKITHFLNVKFDKRNYLLWRSQFLPLLKLHNLKGLIDGTSPCPVRFLLPRRMLSPLSIRNTFAGSSLIRYSYAGLSPHSLRLFLFMSSASYLMVCSALWSESLCHPLELECSNSNTSYTPSKWATLLC